jgi:hypothetical protein
MQTYSAIPLVNSIDLGGQQYTNNKTDIQSANNVFAEINDVRTQPQFKGISFSNFKKPDVRKQLILNIKNGKIEPACYWCAELVCAGHYMEVWETILHYVGKHIHLGNPKIIIYLEKRYEIFRNIMIQGLFLNELQLRNNETIRKLFAEIISTLALSNKYHSFEPITINREEEFDITQLTDRLKAPSMSYLDNIFKKEDPKELFIAMNEFAYNISKDKHSTVGACYWIEWAIDFDAICKKRKNPVYCELRSEVNVEKKFKRDIIWLLWDILFHYCELLENKYIQTLMGSLYTLFCIKYTTASCKKRRYLLYFAVALLTEPVPTNIELMPNKQLIQNVVEKINTVYKQIKKNEQSPKTDYLFANLEKENAFEKTMRQMELMNSMDATNRKPNI